MPNRSTVLERPVLELVHNMAPVPELVHSMVLVLVHSMDQEHMLCGLPYELRAWHEAWQTDHRRNPLVLHHMLVVALGSKQVPVPVVGMDQVQRHIHNLHPSREGEQANRRRLVFRHIQNQLPLGCLRP